MPDGVGEDTPEALTGWERRQASETSPAHFGSIKTIEKYGVLENIVTGPDGDRRKRHYWITTAE